MAHGLEQALSGRAQKTNSWQYFLKVQPSKSHTFMPSASREEALSVLERLAHRMYVEGLMMGAEVNNEWIPAGYTYLGQLLAHDMSFNAAPFSKTDEEFLVLKNLRSAALDLDCIYGGGPSISPQLYQFDPKQTDPSQRTRLRIGYTRTPSRRSEQEDPEKEPLRLEDLPRQCVGDGLSNISERGTVDVRISDRCPFDSLIADHRNEATLIISQLTVFFHKLHNQIVSFIESEFDFNSPEDVFEIARGATIYWYRTVLLEDFLRRIIKESVWKKYKKISDIKGFRFFPESCLSAKIPVVPLEFSMGVLRVGHAMIQPVYKFNHHHTETHLTELLSFRGGQVTESLPIDNSWVIDWRFFFPKLDKNLTPVSMDHNSSRLIRPAITSRLYSEPLFQPSDDHRSSAPQEGVWGGVIYRDFVRAYDANLVTGQSLAVDLKIRNPLGGEEISKYITDFSLINSKKFNPKEIEYLSSGTPLLYYVLLESTLREGGKRLGNLGSIIMAEVLFGICLTHKIPRKKQVKIVVDVMEKKFKRVLTMPDLVDFLAFLEKEEE